MSCAHPIFLLTVGFWLLAGCANVSPAVDGGAIYNANEDLDASTEDEVNDDATSSDGSSGADGVSADTDAISDPQNDTDSGDDLGEDTSDAIDADLDEDAPDGDMPEADASDTDAPQGDARDGDAGDSEVDTCVPNCGVLECGLDPVCGQECGPCGDPDLPVCNEGRCEALCDDDDCEAFTGCSEAFPHVCVAVPDRFCGTQGNLLMVNCLDYSCSPDRTSCDAVEGDDRVGPDCVRDPEGLVVPGSEVVGECFWQSECDEDVNAIVSAERCRSGDPKVELVGTELCLRDTTGDPCTQDAMSGTCFDGECCVPGGEIICPE